MENKEYLETTFPDGTPVKIYPVKEQDPYAIHTEMQIGVVTEKKTGYLEVPSDEMPLFKPMAEVKAEQEYYAKLEQQYWKEEIQRCMKDPQYYFAKYVSFANFFNDERR